MSQSTDNQAPKTNRLNIQNEHIALQHETVKKGLFVLFTAGFTVLQVELFGRAPIIHIQYKPECADLNANTYASVLNPAGRTYVMRAFVEGCIVQWQTNQIH